MCHAAFASIECPPSLYLHGGTSALTIPVKMGVSVQTVKCRRLTNGGPGLSVMFDVDIGARLLFPGSFKAFCRTIWAAFAEWEGCSKNVQTSKSVQRTFTTGGLPYISFACQHITRPFCNRQIQVKFSCPILWTFREIVLHSFFSVIVFASNCGGFLVRTEVMTHRSWLWILSFAFGSSTLLNLVRHCGMATDRIFFRILLQINLVSAVRKWSSLGIDFGCVQVEVPLRRRPDQSNRSIRLDGLGWNRFDLTNLKYPTR